MKSPEVVRHARCGCGERRGPPSRRRVPFPPVALDRLAAAGDPQLRRVLLYARGRRDPFAADDVAVVLGVHRNVARSRLDRLVEAGFLAVTPERRGGRRGPGAGRPAKIYRVAPELEGVEFPDRRLAELITLLVQRVPVRGRPKALREAGAEFGRKLAAAAGLKRSRNVATGLEQVCDALGMLGFQASVVSLDGDHAELTSATCPLRPLVVRCSDAGVIDRGMWAGLIERGVGGVSANRVHCETPRCLAKHASCSVLLSLGLKATQASGRPARG
jgi:predicted ArsR family transcriptional regulator